MPGRLTIRGLMATVGVIGLCVAACRAHVSLGSFAFGVLSITWIRTSAEINRRETTGSPTGLGVVVGIFLNCLVKVAAVLLVCLIPALLLAPCLLSARAPFFLAPLHCHATSYKSPYIEWWLVISTGCALLIFRVIHLWSSPRPAPRLKADPTDSAKPRGFDDSPQAADIECLA